MKSFEDQLIALYIHAAELLKLKMVKTEILFKENPFQNAFCHNLGGIPI